MESEDQETILLWNLKNPSCIHMNFLKPRASDDTSRGSDAHLFEVRILGII